MVSPVPGKGVSTAYGKRGGHWSCNEDANGNGVHTGADFAAPAGTEVVAARPGSTRHVNYGSAFGNHQLAVHADDGGEDFYAHMSTRVPHGIHVAAGDYVGEVGEEGNATGPHLHFERHPQTGSWNCGNHVNPQPSIDYAAIDHGDVFLSRLAYGTQDSDSVRRLQMHLNVHPLSGGETLPVTGNYFDETDEEVRLCQEQHAFGLDPIGASSVGPGQAAHLFSGCGCVIIDDTQTEENLPEPPETDTYPLGIEYHYSGKPGGTFSFGGTYKPLDVDSWAPPKDGYTLGMLYANVDGSGEFRSRLIREAHGSSEDDPTAYQTHYPKSGDNYLLTHIWFEKGEGGRALHYELQSMDGETMNVGTRYVKFLFIPEEVVTAVAEVGAAYMGIRGAILGAIRLARRIL